MGNPKLTGFIIALILIGFFAGIIGLVIANVNENYGVEYTATDLEVYNKLEELSNQSESIKASTDLEEESGVLDVIGSYFKSGYQALKITAKSFNVFDSMSDQAIQKANLGAGGQYLKVTITAIVLILIFVGVIISALVKRDL